jgi:WD40 repeat protein
MLSDREADWDACRSVLEGHIGGVTAVVFSRDGQLIASASRDKTVRVWETATGTCRHELTGHTGYVTAVVFSRDGQLIASASGDKTVRVWETATGTCRHELTGHTGYVTAVVFSPDGQLVASASRSTILRVWETATGTCRHKLTGYIRNVNEVVLRDGQLAFSPDGSALHTNRGDIALPSDLNRTSPVELEDHASHLSVSDQWVLRNTQRFLWLPFEYRADNTAVCQDIVCLGCRSGRVALLRLQ